MKYTTKDTESYLSSPAHSQNSRFDTQLFAYRALIGIPHWQYQPSYHPDLAPQYVDHVRQLRSRAFVDAIKSGVKYLAQRLTKINHQLITWHQHRANMQELSSLSERTLRDIGITHSDIYRLSAKQQSTDELNAYRATLRSDRPERIVTSNNTSSVVAQEGLAKSKTANDSCISHAA